MDIQKIKENMDKWFESEAGQKSMIEFAEKMEFESNLKQKHIDKLKSLFNDQSSFDELVERIIDKHGDVWIELCHSKCVRRFY